MEKKTTKLKNVIRDEIASKERFNEAMKSIEYASAYSPTRGRITLSTEELRQILVDNPHLVDLHLKIKKGENV